MLAGELEQRGIVPMVDEPTAATEYAAADRVFLALGSLPLRAL